MSLMRDEDGRLWDVDLNGKKHTPNFGQEVGEELISGLPMAMGIAKGIFKGMDAVSTSLSTKIANKVLDEDELEELEAKREAVRAKQAADQARAGSGVIGDFMHIAKSGQVDGANNRAILKHFANKIKGKK